MCISKSLNRITFFLVTAILLLNSLTDLAFARAGGRSSFGGGRSSSSYSSQGSRGSRTYEGGGSNGRSYAPVQRSSTAQQNQAKPANNPNQPQSAPNNQSFFQRNPMLSTFGAALAGSWLGSMLFGHGMGGYGSGMGGGGGILANLLIIAIIAFGAMWLIRFLRNRSNASTQGVSDNFSGTSSGPSYLSSFGTSQSNSNLEAVAEINLPQTEKQKFADILTEIQYAWSKQDTDKLKKLATPEMFKYFTDALNQNSSQDIENKVENLVVRSVDVSEAWSEEGMQYATAIMEWSCLDYTINLSKTARDSDYITEGDNQNPTTVTEAWTFTRFGEHGKWILSAIQQLS